MILLQKELLLGGNWDENLDGLKVRIEIPSKLPEKDPELAGIVKEITQNLGKMEKYLHKKQYQYEKKDKSIFYAKEKLKGRWK